MNLPIRRAGAGFGVALLIITLAAGPAAADSKRGDASRCPSGRQHVITSQTTGNTSHRDATRSRTWSKGTFATKTVSTTRTGSEAAYTWEINAKTIPTGGDSCSIL